MLKKPIEYMLSFKTFNIKGDKNGLFSSSYISRFSYPDFSSF